MSIRKKISAVTSERSRPRASRLCRIEILEPRTVLSASPIIVVVFDPGVFADNTPTSFRYESTLRDSAGAARGAVVYQAMLVSSPSVHAAPLPLAKGPGGNSGDEPQPVARSKTSLAPIPPPENPPFARTLDPAPEGESPASSPAVKKPPAPCPDPARLTGRTEPASLANQPPGTTAVGTQSQVNSSLITGTLVSTVTANPWSNDLIGDRHASTQELPYGIRNLTSVVDLSLTNPQVGDIARPVPSTSQTDMELSDFTWWLDDILPDILLPLFDGSSMVLLEAGEGGLVVVPSASPILVSSDSQRSETAPSEQVTPADLPNRAASAAWTPEDKYPTGEQAPAIDPNGPVVETAGRKAQHVLVPRASRTAIAEEEGGMIQPLADTNPAQLETEQSPALEKTEIRMDAEIGFYQTFELSTTPRGSNARAQVTAAE